MQQAGQWPRLASPQAGVVASRGSPQRPGQATFRKMGEALMDELVNYLEQEHNKEIEHLREEKRMLRAELERVLTLMDQVLLPREKNLHEMLANLNDAYEKATEHLHDSLSELSKQETVGTVQRSDQPQIYIDPMKDCEAELTRIRELLSQEPVFAQVASARGSPSPRRPGPGGASGGFAAGALGGSPGGLAGSPGGLAARALGGSPGGLAARALGGSPGGSAAGGLGGSPGAFTAGHLGGSPGGLAAAALGGSPGGSPGGYLGGFAGGSPGARAPSGLGSGSGLGLGLGAGSGGPGSAASLLGAPAASLLGGGGSRLGSAGGLGGLSPGAGSPAGPAPSLLGPGSLAGAPLAASSPGGRLDSGTIRHEAGGRLFQDSYWGRNS